jgi:ELWxxDGT repeat protein
MIHYHGLPMTPVADMVKSFAGPDEGSVSGLKVCGSLLIFRADDGTTGVEPWKTNGTSAGTSRLKDIRPGSVGSGADFFTYDADAEFDIFQGLTAADVQAFQLDRKSGQAAELLPLLLDTVAAFDMGPLCAQWFTLPSPKKVFSDRGTVWFHLIQTIGVLGAIGTLVVLYNAIQSWLNREKRVWGKLQATLFVLACLGFLWFTFAGNLLHFNSNY